MYHNKLLIWAHPQKLVKIGHMVKEVVKRGVGELGGLGGKGVWEMKNFFLHPNELLISAYPENLVKNLTYGLRGSKRGVGEGGLGVKKFLPTS